MNILNIVIVILISVIILLFLFSIYHYVSQKQEGGAAGVDVKKYNGWIGLFGFIRKAGNSKCMDFKLGYAGRAICQKKNGINYGTVYYPWSLVTVKKNANNNIMFMCSEAIYHQDNLNTYTHTDLQYSKYVSSHAGIIEAEMHGIMVHYLKQVFTNLINEYNKLMKPNPLCTFVFRICGDETFNCDMPCTNGNGAKFGIQSYAEIFEIQSSVFDTWNDNILIKNIMEPIIKNLAYVLQENYKFEDNNAKIRLKCGDGTASLMTDTIKKLINKVFTEKNFDTAETFTKETNEQKKNASAFQKEEIKTDELMQLNFKLLDGQLNITTSKNEHEMDVYTIGDFDKTYIEPTIDGYGEFIHTLDQQISLNDRIHNPENNNQIDTYKDRIKKIQDEIMAYENNTSNIQNIDTYKEDIENELIEMGNDLYDNRLLGYQTRTTYTHKKFNTFASNVSKKIDEAKAKREKSLTSS